jgi:hypothetical protein
VAVRADHFEASGALPAIGGAATPRCVDKHPTEFGVFPDDLVTEHDWERPAEVPVRDVNIRVTNTAGNDLDDFLARAGDGDIAFLGNEGLIRIDENQGFHGTSTLRCQRAVAGGERLGYSIKYCISDTRIRHSKMRNHGSTH